MISFEFAGWVCELHWTDAPTPACLPTPPVCSNQQARGGWASVAVLVEEPLAPRCAIFAPLAEPLASVSWGAADVCERPEHRL